MIRLLGFTLLTFLVCQNDLLAQKKVNLYLLDNIRGLYYQRNHMQPFTGIAIANFPNGSKQHRIPIKNGKAHGTAREWSPEGQKLLEIVYVNGKREGRERQYYDDGTRRLEVYYQNDLPHGTVTEWHKNGKLKSRGEVVNGRYHGKHTWWFVNGRVDQEISYMDGAAHGLVKEWFDTGELRKTTDFEKGHPHGKTIEWYKNGNKMSEQTFVHGKEDGLSKFWAKDSRILEEKTFEQGQLVKTKDFRSASIKTKFGYVYVFNLLHSNFTLKLESKDVRPIHGGALTFWVDGKVIQFFTRPIASLKKTATETLTNNELLVRHLEKEKRVLTKDLETEKLDITTEKFTFENGEIGLFWSFKLPNPITKNKLKIVEEQYVSFVCKNHVVSVNGLVMNANPPDEIKALIAKVANTLEVQAQPIDIIAFSKSLLK